jgi:hypothetical protein
VSLDLLADLLESNEDWQSPSLGLLGNDRPETSFFGLGVLTGHRHRYPTGTSLTFRNSNNHALNDPLILQPQ